MKDSVYGTELVLDCLCPNTHLFNYTGIKLFCAKLCELLGTEPVGFNYVDSDPEDELNPKTHGFSACQFIVASSITMHGLDIGDKKGTLFINVFSCEMFNESAVACLCAKYFNTIRIEHTNLERSW